MHGGLWKTYEDHRMATAGAIIGLRVPGVLVENVETTSKTMPNFPAMWQKMLGETA
jgi:3-phosphoshikimate 1-carboxyvinyltransferase